MSLATHAPPALWERRMAAPLCAGPEARACKLLWAGCKGGGGRGKAWACKPKCSPHAAAHVTVISGRTPFRTRSAGLRTKAPQMNFEIPCKRDDRLLRHITRNTARVVCGVVRAPGISTMRLILVRAYLRLSWHAFRTRIPWAGFTPNSAPAPRSLRTEQGARMRGHLFPILAMAFPRKSKF